MTDETSNIKPKLGQRVSASDQLARFFTRDNSSTLEWKRYGDIAVLKPKPVEGVYVGSRTKQNGSTDYWPDEGHTWNRTGDVQVWLIAFADRQKPAVVLPEDCFVYNQPEGETNE